ncbi:hypothetical protein [Enterococcus sp. AZ109]|uniref:hypothetical protein n=1 Tax=Enterococcus sp. AZ109 TaxID=2774634 RepID=UPI003F24907B
MTTKPLSQRQIYTMGVESLAARFQYFFDQTQDSPYIIQCAVAVLVRNALCTADFSFFAKELICSLFLTSHPRELRSVRHLCVYFADYFTPEEWQTVTTRLFKTNAEFLRLTQNTRAHIEKLKPFLYSTSRPVETKASLVSVFTDENGKRHGWTLSNVDPALTSQQCYDLLKILTSLSLFKKEGVRRFAQVIKAEITETNPRFNTLDDEDPAANWQESVQLEAVTETTNLVPETVSITDDAANENTPVNAKSSPPDTGSKPMKKKPGLTLDDVKKRLTGRLPKKNNGKQQLPMTGKKKDRKRNKRK